MKFKNIAIIGKSHAKELTLHVNKLAAHLQQLGVNVYVDCKFLSDLLNNLDLVIVIGGDGTFLSVAREVVNHNIPVVGINQGKLGFMTDISVDEMYLSIDKIVLSGMYVVESRSLINARVIRNGSELLRAIALNDVVISRGAIGNMIEFDISIDNQFVLSQKSDGVIFSTPTGSTAYSLAAGGPIIYPEASVFSIVPICPQSLTNRPLVVHDTAKVEFDLVSGNATQIHFDGQECFDLCFQDKVVLEKHQKEFQIIHPHEYNYYKTLRTKLYWSKRVS